MDFLELAKERYSARKFTDRPVEAEKIEKILKAAQFAPTACNNQPQKILVLQSKEALEKWSRCVPFHFNEQLVILTCYDKELSWKRRYDGCDSGYVDASIVTTHMMMEAWEEGIGSTWVMAFIPEAVRCEFSIPENLEVVSALPMGYIAEDCPVAPQHEKTRDMDEMVYFL